MTKNNTKKSGTDLVPVDTSRVEKLREASGVQEGEGAKWLPRLKVNRTPIDDDGNQLPMGKYVVTHEEKLHFMDEVDAIVLAKGTQFMRFEKVDGKTQVDCTMIEDTFSPEYKDTLGGHRLGRVPGMDRDDMTDQQKDAKFFFHVLALIDVKDAVDQEGKAIYTSKESVFVPVSLQFGGRRAVTIKNALHKIKKNSEAYFDFNILLNKPERDKVGDNIFYTFDITRGDNTVYTNELLDSVEAAKNIIETENKRIYSRYLKASQEVQQLESDADYTDLDIVD